MLIIDAKALAIVLQKVDCYSDIILLTLDVEAVRDWNEEVRHIVARCQYIGQEVERIECVERRRKIGVPKDL